MREVSDLAAFVSFFSEHGRRPNRNSAISYETQGFRLAVLLSFFNTVCPIVQLEEKSDAGLKIQLY